MAAEDGFNAWVSIVADYLSLVSPVLSGLALFNIRRVRKELTTRSLLPDILDRLTEINSNIAVSLQDFDNNKDDFSNEIVKCRASLRPISQMKNNAGQDAKKILKLMKGFGGSGIPILGRLMPDTLDPTTEKKAARKIYEEINGLIEEVKRLMAEQRMGV